jgi:TonB family protein
MAETEERELQRHGRGGLIVIVVLALIFFTILFFLLFATRDSTPPRPSEPAELYVVPLKMRIRTQPTARSAVVDHASRGELLKVLESTGAWVRVQTPDNLVGWAERSALETADERDRRLERTAAIRRLAPMEGMVLEDTPLYSGPGLFYPVLGEATSKSKVKVFTRDHDFYAVDAAGGVAYVEVDAVDLSGPGTELEVAAAPEETTEPSTATESVAETVPEPEPEPAPVPEPSRPDRGGVYTAVPAGGTEPTILTRTVPDYPFGARRAGIEGPVVLRGIVRRDGRIDELEIVRDQPRGLGDAARRAVRRWRFRPATLNGEPIDVYYTVTVNYKLSN